MYFQAKSSLSALSQQKLLKHWIVSLPRCYEMKAKPMNLRHERREMEMDGSGRADVISAVLRAHFIGDEAATAAT